MKRGSVTFWINENSIKQWYEAGSQTQARGRPRTYSNTVGRRGAKSAILLQKKAKIRKRKNKETESLVRGDIVRRMRQVGRKKWKQEVCYHRRSLVENAFYRYKTILGGKLRSISIENQKVVEALIGCNILNKFAQFGRCVSYITEK